MARVFATRPLAFADGRGVAVQSHEVYCDGVATGITRAWRQETVKDARGVRVPHVTVDRYEDGEFSYDRKALGAGGLVAWLNERMDAREAVK